MLLSLFVLFVPTASANDCAGGGNLPPAAALSTAADLIVRPDSLGGGGGGGGGGGELLGSAVATGDFDGDGLGDFAVGAPGEQGGRGVVRVYLGRLGLVPNPTQAASPDAFLLDDEADLTLVGEVDARLGRGLASGGDLAATGADVLLIGDEGGAWAVDVQATLGGAASMDIDAADAGRFEALTPGDDVGGQVGAAWLGGVNGHWALWVTEGATLHLFENPAAAGFAVPDLTVDLSDPSNPAALVSAAVAMDWDDDGEVDLVVGCATCAQGGSVPGGVLFFAGADATGSTDLTSADAGAALWGSGAAHRFGQALAVLPGRRLAMGAPNDGMHGRVHVSNLTVPAAPTLDAVLEGSNVSGTGGAVAVADLNDDGEPELIAGGPEAMIGTSRYGMIRVAQEIPLTGTLSTPWYMSGPGGGGTLGARFGRALAVGDVNGDLLDDLVIGTPRGVLGAQTGMVHVILGGLDGNLVANDEIVQYLDGDADGVGAGASFIRCVLEGVEQGGDCDDADPARHPNQLEACGTPVDDDCLAVNDDVLCEPRFATAPVEPATDLAGSLWCYEDASWEIGPQAGDVVSLAELANMLLAEELFFGDLDHGMVGDVGPVASCLSHVGPTVTLDVIGRMPSEVDWATSRYDDVLSDNVYDRLRDQPQGYLIGQLDVGVATSGPHFVILGGDYPGVVNGVVDLLRATEGTAPARSPWRNQTVLDAPEVARRALQVDPIGALASCHTGYDDEADPAVWASCTDAATGRDGIDLAVRYHYNLVRSAVVFQGSAPREFGGFPAQTQASVLKEATLYLRRRGVDVLPFVSVVPSSQPGSGSDSIAWEPLGVDRLAVTPVDGTGANTWAMPCGSDDCSDDLDFTPNDYVFNRKYAMSLAGPDEGVVYARDFLGGAPVSGTHCKAAQVAAACTTPPCWCVQGGATADADDILLEGAGGAYLRFADMSLPAAGAHPLRDDGYYSVFGEDVFRPGRLYALKLSVSVDAVGAGGAGFVQLRPATVGAFYSGKIGTTITPDPAGPVHVSYVFRAPLQGSEIPEDNAHGDPGLYLGGLEPLPADTTLRVHDMTLVELDGLSNGWLHHPDLNGEAAARVDEPGWLPGLADLSTPTYLGCDVTVPGCVPYETTTTCGGLPKPWADVWYPERFVVGPGAVMPAPHVVRLRMAGPVMARVSGVVSPLIGSYQHDPCANLWMEGKPTRSAQVPELYDPEIWLGKWGLHATLKFLGKPRAPWSNTSLQDYLLGEGPGGPYAWAEDDPRIYTNILDEVRLWNTGLAGWHEGLYRPVPNHQLVRGLFCNIANLVDDVDWNDNVVPYEGYCASYTADGRNCQSHPDTPSLLEDVPCSLDRQPGSSGVRVHIDNGMTRDATTLDHRGDYHIGMASLSPGYLTADIDATTPTRPADWTVPNTVADNVDTRVWSYPHDPQDIYESACDAVDFTGALLDHPGLVGHYGGDQATRNACMMTGRVPEGLAYRTVHGTAATGSPESIRSWASLAAGHPELVSEVALADFDLNGAEPALTDTWFAYGGECLWNPGGASVALLSMANAKDDPLASRLCEPGTPWASVWNATPAGTAELYPMEALSGADGKDALTTDGDWHLVAMRPEAASMVELPADAAGRVVRVEVAVSISPDFPLNADACSVGRALVHGTHELDVPAPLDPWVDLSGPVSGGLWFADASGQLLDASGAVQPATSCYTAAGPSSLGTLPVSVRPAMVNHKDLFIAHVSMEVVVPADAVKVGAWLAVPGCPLDNCRPANGAFQFELLTAPDPEVVPAWWTVDDAYPVVGPLPRPQQPILPRSCRDPLWLRRTAFDADEILGSGAPSDRAAQEQCFLDAVNNWPVP